MQIILVHIIIKSYYSNPSCCREIQGDEKLHHPPEWDIQRPPPGIGLKPLHSFYGNSLDISFQLNLEVLPPLTLSKGKYFGKKFHFFPVLKRKDANFFTVCFVDSGKNVQVISQMARSSGKLSISNT